MTLNIDDMEFDIKTCPECGRKFTRGWTGYKGHWDKEHSNLMLYGEAMPLVKQGIAPSKRLSDGW